MMMVIIAIYSMIISGITQKFGYTHVVRGQIKHSQAGAVRVNCMDSLDRTNVVQGAIARHTLSNQVIKLFKQGTGTDSNQVAVRHL